MMMIIYMFHTNIFDVTLHLNEINLNDEKPNNPKCYTGLTCHIKVYMRHICNYYRPSKDTSCYWLQWTSASDIWSTHSIRLHCVFFSWYCSGFLTYSHWVLYKYLTNGQCFRYKTVFAVFCKVQIQSLIET